MVMQPIPEAQARTRVIPSGKVYAIRRHPVGQPMPTRVVVPETRNAPVRLGTPAPSVAQAAPARSEEGMIAGLLIAPWIIAAILVLSYVLLF